MDNKLTLRSDDQLRLQYENLRRAKAAIPVLSQMKVIKLSLWRQARSLEAHARERLHEDTCS
jgi:hypothetical protein